MRARPSTCGCCYDPGIHWQTGGRGCVFASRVAGLLHSPLSCACARTGTAAAGGWGLRTLEGSRTGEPLGWALQAAGRRAC